MLTKIINSLNSQFISDCKILQIEKLNNKKHDEIIELYNVRFNKHDQLHKERLNLLHDIINMKPLILEKFNLPVELIIGSCGILILIEATRRVFGLPLVIIAVCFLLFSY